MEELEHARDDLRLAASQVRRLAGLMRPHAGSEHGKLTACARVPGSLALRLDRTLIQLERRTGPTYTEARP
jgi:hypothetical protein